MTWPLTIELAGEPRGKGAPRATMIGGQIRAYTDAKTRSYESQLRYCAQQAMAGAPPTAQPVDVHIIAALPIPQSFSQGKRLAAMAGTLRPTVKPDCNNLSKALDSLNGVVWLDDKQIVEERVSKIYAAAPFLRVIVKPIPPDVLVTAGQPRQSPPLPLLDAAEAVA